MNRSERSGCWGVGRAMIKAHRHVKVQCRTATMLHLQYLSFENNVHRLSAGLKMFLLGRCVWMHDTGVGWQNVFTDI